MRVYILLTFILFLNCRANLEEQNFIVISTSRDIESVNELLGASRFNNEIINLMFLHLFKEQPDFHKGPPTLLPEIVEVYKWTNPKELYVTFKKGIYWSNGEEVSAQDLLFTYKAQTSTDVGWPYSFVKEEIERIEIIDKYTMKVSFSKRYRNALYDLNEGVVLPSVWKTLPFKKWRVNGEWFLENLVVSGPYKIERWFRKQEIVLSSNSSYYLFSKGYPLIKKVVVRIYPDQEGQVNALLRKEVDFVSGVSPIKVDKIIKDPDLDIKTFWPRQFTFIVWNLQRQPFDKREVRLALTLGIDREKLVKTLWRGYAKVAVSPVISSVWAYNRNLKPWPYNPQMARDLLLKIGFSDKDGDGIIERNGREFVFELLTNVENRIRRDAVLLIKEDLSKLGIKVVPRFLDLATVIDLNRKHRFDASLAAWGIDTTLDFTYAFHSKQIDGGENYGGYSSAEVDTLLEKIREESDLNKLRDYLWKMQEIIHYDQPYTFLWEPMRIVAYNKRLKNVQSNYLLSLYNLHEWYINSGR